MVLAPANKKVPDKLVDWVISEKAPVPSDANMWLVTKVKGLGEVYQEMLSALPCTSRQVRVADDCPWALKAQRRTVHSNVANMIFPFIRFEECKNRPWVAYNRQNQTELKRNIVYCLLHLAKFGNCLIYYFSSRNYFSYASAYLPNF